MGPTASTHRPWPLPEDIEPVVSEYPYFEEIAAEMHSWLAEDSSGHDMDHVWRVFVLGIRLARAEGGDERVVGAAALTHDIHRVMGDDEFVHPSESLHAVRDILDATGFPDPLVEAVCHCVEVHDEYEFRGIEYPAETVEAEMLRDADNLDAMGAIGVARCFAFNALADNPLWRPQSEAPDTDEDSGLGHFEDKLYRLCEEMHTETAREIAAKRHEFLETFEDRFKKEWHGER